ncbi:MAG: hypothetical protein ACKO2P_08645 [Planctomycetota bacterium]
MDNQHSSLRNQLPLQNWHVNLVNRQAMVDGLNSSSAGGSPWNDFV